MAYHERIPQVIPADSRMHDVDADGHWDAEQVGRSVVVRDGGGTVLRTFNPPDEWGDDWGWHLYTGGVAITRRP